MGLANRLYNVHKKIHRDRSIIATPRRAKAKNGSKKKIDKPQKFEENKTRLQISYRSYIKHRSIFSSTSCENHTVHTITITLSYVL